MGTFGAAAAFSFYPSKNLGACGDGGILVTGRRAVYEAAKSMRHYGQRVRYDHERLGYNSRLDTLQAALLSVKLKRLDAWNAARRRAAGWYDEELRGVPVLTPVRPAGAESVYHLYAVRGLRRDALLRHLEKAGVGVGIHYDRPLHLQKCFAGLGYRAGDFPNAERAAAEMLSLPMFPEITRAQVRRVAKEIRRFYGSPR